MARMVKRLSNLEIDEVSLVDRPANQHGLVTIAKNDQEDQMDPDLYDAEGELVDSDELRPGDHVYTQDGTEFVYTESDGDEGEEAYEDERELASVGKAAFIPSGPLREGGSRLGMTASHHADRQKLATQMFLGRKQPQVERHVARNKNRYLIGAGGVGAVGAGYGGGKMSKSFGEEVLVELSKALNTGERDSVIAKALDRVEEVAKRNEDLESVVAWMVEQRELGDFSELAKSYDGLAADPDELAGVLQRASHVLDEDDLRVLDRVLGGASEVGKALYTELGYGGRGESDILEEIAAMSDEAVIKSSELGVTSEQAMTAIFSANPEAYDQYVSETR